MSRSKNLIRIDDEAYSALAGRKAQGETFNDVVHELLEADA